MPSNDPNFALYLDQSKFLLERQATLVVPILVQGLKDKDLQVRQISVNTLKDIAAMLLVDNLPTPPKLGKEALYFEYLDTNRKLIESFQPLFDKLVEYIPPCERHGRPRSRHSPPGRDYFSEPPCAARNRVQGWSCCSLERASAARGAAGETAESAAGKATREARGQGSGCGAAPSRNLLATGRTEETGRAEEEGGRFGTAPPLAHARSEERRTALERNLSDPNPVIRRAAMEALEYLGPDVAPSMPAIVQALLTGTNSFVGLCCGF